jgi:hypothetical protein
VQLVEQFSKAARRAHPEQSCGLPLSVEVDSPHPSRM